MASAGFDPDNDLPPPGHRWGSGAQSVLPYLTKSLQARPAAAGGNEPREREQQTAAPQPSLQPHS